jgi:hypothetical protein
MDPLTDMALKAVSMVSPALAQAEREDSPEALAAALAAARLVVERVETALAGRIDEATVNATQNSAQTALGW